MRNAAANFATTSKSLPIHLHKPTGISTAGIAWVVIRTLEDGRMDAVIHTEFTDAEAVRNRWESMGYKPQMVATSIVTSK